MFTPHTGDLSTPTTTGAASSGVQLVLAPPVGTTSEDPETGGATMAASPSSMAPPAPCSSSSYLYDTCDSLFDSVFFDEQFTVYSSAVDTPTHIPAATPATSSAHRQLSPIASESDAMYDTASSSLPGPPTDADDHLVELYASHKQEELEREELEQQQQDEKEEEEVVRRRRRDQEEDQEEERELEGEGTAAGDLLLDPSLRQRRIAKSTMMVSMGVCRCGGV